MLTLQKNAIINYTRSIPNQKEGSLGLLPHNGNVFNLRDSFLFMKKENMAVNQFYDLATDPELNPKHPMILCSCATFFRKHKLYLITDILSTIVDEEFVKGRSQLVVNNNLNVFNKEIDTTIGLGGNIHILAHVTKVK